MIIKVLLVVALGSAVLFAMRTQARGNHLAVRRIAAAGFLMAGALAVLFPETTTVVANWVGVGRGTDLLLYVLVVAFLFVTIGLYQRLHSLERRFVDLARELALSRALGDSVATEDSRP
jgi:small membrane protein